MDYSPWLLGIVLLYLSFLEESVSAECIYTKTGNTTTVRCLPKPGVPDPKPSNYPEIYVIVVAIGVILIPLTICFRVCWARKLQSDRMRALNQARIRLDSQREERQNMEVYAIDLDGSSMPQIFGTPPSYEQCIIDSPPPYDAVPPPYKDTDKDSKIETPSTSTSNDTNDTVTSSPVN